MSLNFNWYKENMSSTSMVGYSSEDFKDFIKANLKQEVNNRVFESGSQRDDDSKKPLTTALTAYARLRYGFLLRMGSNKYEKNNWKLGQPDEALLESLDRHLCQYMLGDRSEDHLASIMFGVVMLMQNEEREGVEVDRYFRLPEESKL